jgi:hypothetical protein
MSKYVSHSGYAGTDYDQSAIWHYKMDFDRNLTNRWLVNLFEQGVIVYTPVPAAPAGETAVTVSAGTSFLIEEKTKVSPVFDAERRIAKVDMVLDYDIDVPAVAGPTDYYLIAQWSNIAFETVGVDFSLVESVPAGENYVVFGTVEVTNGVVTANTTDGQTVAAVPDGLSGYSGYTGISGYSAWSGYSAASGTSGWSGELGESGFRAGTAFDYNFQTGSPILNYGEFYYNNTTPSMTTSLTLSYFDQSSTDVLADLQMFAPGNPIRFVRQSDPSQYHQFSYSSYAFIAGAPLEIIKFPAVVWDGGTDTLFPDDEPCYIQIARSGVSGYAGPGGISGYSGYSDSVSGTSGYSGYSDSTSGYSGWSGVTGYSAAPSATIAQIWPIHSIFFTADDVSPGHVTKLNYGTWTQRAQGRFIVGAGGEYVGEGGKFLDLRHRHLITVNASTDSIHTHTMSATARTGLVAASSYKGTVDKEEGTNFSVAHSHLLTDMVIESTGTAHTHAQFDSSNNLDPLYYPPYYTLRVWERTA